MPRKPRIAKATAAEGNDVDGYVRVSTEEQANDGTSLINQEEKIRLHCQLHDLRLVKIIRDPGYSAKSLDRPGLKELLDDLDRGRASGMVITKLDRLTRSLRDWSDLIDRYFSERAGRRLFSVSDSIDTHTAAGRMVLNVILTVSQWEREVIGERTRDALQGKIRRGERCGRLRYGYQLSADGKCLTPLPREQEIIAKMRAWRDQGFTYQEMVRMLNELGIETKGGGQVWLPATIHRILHRPIA